MSVEKNKLEISTALDGALVRWLPLTEIDAVGTQAQTRQAADHLTATGDAYSEVALVEPRASEGASQWNDDAVAER